MSATNVARAGKRGNICVGNNVSLFASTFKRVPYYLFFCYMASSRGQDEPNRALCIPEQARWSYPARSGLPTVSRQINFLESYIKNPLLIKLVRPRWLDISGLRSFFASLSVDHDFVSVHKIPGQSPANLTSPLINNPYIAHFEYCIIRNNHRHQGQPVQNWHKSKFKTCDPCDY